jgi:broad specificity phosphatase PhoE
VTRRLVFITHAEVAIDPAVPVTDWPLSAEGRRRHAAAARDPVLDGVAAVYCSTERKAIDGATILAAARALPPPRQVAALHENDRSATGYLPPPEFEATADLFFAHPERSVRGWERAVDAQARIVAAIDRIRAEDRSGGDVAVVAHGGVGALLLCHARGVPIARALDQPGRGGGNLFVLAMAGGEVIEGWRRMDPAG